MKVLHVLDVSWPIQRGYSIRACYITKYQKALGIEPVVLTSERQYDHNIDGVYEGIKYYRTKKKRDIFSRKPILREISELIRLKKRIREIVDREEIDIIHAHSPSLWGLAALWVGKGLHKKVVYEIRAFWEDAAVDAGKFRENGLLYKIYRGLETILARKVDKVVVISKGLENDLVARNIPRAKIVLVPNGIDTKAFIPMLKCDKITKKYDLRDKIVLGFVGSMFNFEGLELLVEAVSRLQGKSDNLRVILVGEGQKYSYIKRIVERKGLKHVILLVGKVPHQEIKDFYSVIDILVYPRISKRLTELVTPLKPLEAMAMGKTVLISDVGGLKELLPDQNCGVLFKAGSVADLSEKLHTLISSPEKTSSIGESARQAIVHQREWGTLAQIYTDKVYI
jgi:PEP-CTERM/exosortase A-associated glycosyltransferase